MAQEKLLGKSLEDMGNENRPVFFLHCVDCINEGVDHGFNAGVVADHPDGPKFVVECRHHKKIILVQDWPEVPSCAHCEAGTHGHKH